MNRRGFVFGLAAFSIVRPGILMPIKLPVALAGRFIWTDEGKREWISADSLLTPQMITREALSLFRNSNAFLQRFQFEDNLPPRRPKPSLRLPPN